MLQYLTIDHWILLSLSFSFIFLFFIVQCYMRQLLTGLHYCHVNQVLHRDIKGQHGSLFFPYFILFVVSRVTPVVLQLFTGSNLLIDNEGNLKLADFGLARSFSNDHNGNLTNRVITLWYRQLFCSPSRRAKHTRTQIISDKWFCLTLFVFNVLDLLNCCLGPQSMVQLLICGQLAVSLRSSFMGSRSFLVKMRYSLLLVISSVLKNNNHF